MFLKEKCIKIIKSNSKPVYPDPPGVTGKGKIEGVKAVLFDVYGTMFVSGSGDISVSEKEAHIDEVRRVLENHGIEKDPADVYRRYLEEIEKEHSRLRASGIDYPEVKIEEIWGRVLKVGRRKAKLISVEYESIVNPVWPMPDLKDVLSLLKSKGIIMGIISNAQFYTGLLFEAMLGERLSRLGFCKKLVLYSYKLGTAKPSEKIFLVASDRLSQLGVAEREAVYVGNDMLNDILPAVKTGFKTALFAGDKRSLRLRENDKRCREVRPDIVITSLRELLERVDFTPPVN